jgi:acetyltransferase-like isoleucine patch superfamily enzyme
MSPLRDPAEFGFASYGRNLRIYELVRITSPELIAIGDEVMIDDFVFLQGRKSMTIGSYVHVTMFSTITGGGDAVIGDFASIGPGVRILSGTDLADGSGLTNPTVPDEHRAVERSFVDIGQYVYIGANAVVQAGVRIGEGAAIGSASLVREDIEPWTINVGSPTRVIRARPREEILRRAELVRRDAGLRR